MEIFFFWVLLAVGVGALAANRGRSGFGYFMLALIISPLIGLIVVLVIEDKTKKAEAQAESERATEREHQRRLAEVRALAAAQAPRSAESAPAPRGISVADELTKLVTLRDQGVLTQEEFAAQKARLLGGSAAAAPAPVASAPPPREDLGKCSRCGELVPLFSMSCPKCKAIFSGDSAYKVLRQ